MNRDLPKKMLTNETIDKLIGVDESFHASYKLFEILKDKTKREKLFENFLQIESDLSFDWFTEYYQSEHSDRKGKMQDFTPDGIAELCNLILGHTKSNSDICAGTGGLTIKRWSSNKDSVFYCEEFSDRAIPFLLFNLSIRNIEGIILHGDALKQDYKNVYKLSSTHKFSDISIVESAIHDPVDTIVMNPPYSQSWEPIQDKRFNSYGIAPKSKADYAFLLHGVSKLSNDGKIAIVLPHGVLFRGGAEKVIRKSLIDHNMLDAVIGMPGKAFMNTDIPTVIMVLKKERTNNDVLFIDASEEFTKEKAYNVIEEKHFQKTFNVLKERKTVERFSQLTELKEIQRNDYNLNLPRYVDNYIPEEVKPLNEIMADMKEIDEQINESSQYLATMLLDLVGTNPEDDKMIKEFSNFFADRHGTRPLPQKEKEEPIDIEVVETEEKEERMEQLSLL